MATKCYAQVRGSALRVTKLTNVGSVTEPIQYAVSKSAARVVVNEVNEDNFNEMVRSDPTAQDERRLFLTKPGGTVRYTTDVDFIRVDPGVLTLVSGVPLVLNTHGDVAGFDSKTKLRAVSFGLEVWTRLAGAECAPSGEREWGYSVLPWLRGGYLSGFEFANGLVSFNLRGAQTRKVSRWGVGPWDLYGSAHQRLLSPVSRNTMIINFAGPTQPPTQTDGIQTATDVIEGGSASSTSPDVVDGEFVATSPWIIDRGRAV